jgi:hypothetical protein
LRFYGFGAGRVCGTGQCRSRANWLEKSRSRAKPPNLQDFAVFQRALRAFKGIRPTGKGSGPLPVIDFKRNLQN